MNDSTPARPPKNRTEEFCQNAAEFSKMVWDSSAIEARGQRLRKYFPVSWFMGSALFDLVGLWIVALPFIVGGLILSSVLAGTGLPGGEVVKSLAEWSAHFGVTPGITALVITFVYTLALLRYKERNAVVEMFHGRLRKIRDDEENFVVPGEKWEHMMNPLLAVSVILSYYGMYQFGFSEGFSVLLVPVVLAVAGNMGIRAYVSRNLGGALAGTESFMWKGDRDTMVFAANLWTVLSLLYVAQYELGVVLFVFGPHPESNLVKSFVPVAIVLGWWMMLHLRMSLEQDTHQFEIKPNRVLWMGVSRPFLLYATIYVVSGGEASPVIALFALMPLLTSIGYGSWRLSIGPNEHLKEFVSHYAEDGHARTVFSDDYWDPLFESIDELELETGKVLSSSVKLQNKTSLSMFYTFVKLGEFQSHVNSYIGEVEEEIEHLSYEEREGVEKALESVYSNMDNVMSHAQMQEEFRVDETIPPENMHNAIAGYTIEDDGFSKDE